MYGLSLPYSPPFKGNVGGVDLSMIWVWPEIGYTVYMGIAYTTFMARFIRIMRITHWI